MAEVRTVSATGGEKGAKEARFDLIPPFVLLKLAEHYGRGALKYADHNWRKGYKWSLSHAALLRHLNAFWDGEDFDVCKGHEVDCAFEDKDGNPFEGVPGVSCYNHTGNHHLDGVNFHGFALRYFAEFLPDYDDRFTTTNPVVETTELKADDKVVSIIIDNHDTVYSAEKMTRLLTRPTKFHMLDMEPKDDCPVTGGCINCRKSKEK